MPRGSFAPSATDIARLLEQHVADLTPALDQESSRQFLAEVDALCVEYVVRAFTDLGIGLRRDHRMSVSSLAATAGIASVHHRLLGRLVQMLEEDGIVGGDGDGWCVCGTPTSASPEATHARLLNRYPAHRAELILLDRCGSALPHVLRGQVDPLQVLFPGGSTALLEAFYTTTPIARVLNTIIKEAVMTVAESTPASQPFRILEVGGGTGGTTADVVAAIDARSEYVFTDVSGFFTRRAARRFRQDARVRCQQLDLEHDPGAQGYVEGQFHVIIAASVLHATTDVARSLRHVRRLMAPGGILVMREGIARHRRADLVFGLTRGWWHFTDLEVRPSYPLLSARAWCEVLAREGFGAVVVPADADARSDLGLQAIVIAQSADF